MARCRFNLTRECHSKDCLNCVLEDIKAEILWEDEKIKSIRSDGRCFFTADEIISIIEKHMIQERM